MLFAAELFSHARAWRGVASLMITAPDDQEDEAQWLFEQFVPQSALRSACRCAPGACG